MKYQSEIIHEILEQRGHKKSSLHYQSECIEKWIEETKGAYPKLTDYQAEWLNYIIENPVGEFPYITLTNVTEATVDNVVPYAYKSAILKGNTLVNSFMCKSLDDFYAYGNVTISDGVYTLTSKNSWDTKMYPKTESLNVKPSTTYTLILYVEENTTVNTGTEMLEIGEISNQGVSMFDTKYRPSSLSIGTNKFLLTTKANFSESEFGFVFRLYSSVSGVLKFKMSLVEGDYTNTDIPYFTDMQSVKMPVLTTSNEDGTKTNILTVNEDVTLRSNGNICDELNLLNGQLTQRIDEDGEVLSQEVVKTVELSISDESGNKIGHFKPIEGTMHIQTDGTPIKPSVTMEIPVEAITQNLASFIEGE